MSDDQMPWRPHGPTLTLREGDALAAAMMIYVLNRRHDYEGESTVGVFASLAEAVKAVKAANAATHQGDGLYIYAAKVGSLDEPKQVWSEK